MVLTPSTMLPLGTKAPAFSLLGVDGRTVSLADFAGAKALLVIFMCNHCPYVKHVAPALADLAREYQAQGVAVVGINSNDTPTHPADSPEQMVLEAENRGYTFPYLFDEDSGSRPGLQGRLHARFLRLRQGPETGLSRPNGCQPAGQRSAGDRRRSAGGARRACWPARRFRAEQRPSIGCNIKWKPGREPAYF